MLPHTLPNFEIQKYYQNEPKFNDVYSRNKLLKIKDRAYVINLDDFKSRRTRWIVLHVKGNDNTIYFDNFGVEHIPKEIEKVIANKIITTNIYRRQAYDSIKCGYFCIGFIDFILKGKNLLDYTNQFSKHLNLCEQ